MFILYLQVSSQYSRLPETIGSRKFEKPLLYVATIAIQSIEDIEITSSAVKTKNLKFFFYRAATSNARNGRYEPHLFQFNAHEQRNEYHHN